MKTEVMSYDIIKDFDDEGVYDRKRNKRTTLDNQIYLEENKHKTVAELIQLVVDINSKPLHEPSERDLYEDFVEAIIQEEGVSKEVAALVYNKAYQEGHANGISEIAGYASDFAEFAMDILKTTETP